MSKSIITDNEDYCYICGKQKEHMHHCIYGSRRKLADEDGLTIPLCSHCHSLLHHNGFTSRYYQKVGQRAYERLYGHDKFMERYGKNFLD